MPCPFFTCKCPLPICPIPYGTRSRLRLALVGSAQRQCFDSVWFVPPWREGCKSWVICHLHQHPSGSAQTGCVLCHFVLQEMRIWRLLISSFLKFFLGSLHLPWMRISIAYMIFVYNFYYTWCLNLVFQKPTQNSLIWKLGHCPESASHHIMLNLTCKTFWPLKDLDTFTAAIVALEVCSTPPVQELRRIPHRHIWASLKKMAAKFPPSLHVLEEAVQFLLPFYHLFWPEEKTLWALQDLEFFAVSFSFFSAWIPTVMSPLSNCTWGRCLSVWSLHVIHRFFN